MRPRSRWKFLAAGSLVLCLILVGQASAVIVEVATFKDSSVFSEFPFDSDPFNIDLDATISDMSYIAIDLNEIAEDEGVPASQIQLNSVQFRIVDWRTTRNGTNILYLADVPADWNETQITWFDAAAGYGASGGPGAADLDPSKELWEGRLDFTSTTIVDVAATSEPPYTDADLLSAIQTDLSTGDGQVVFVMRGTLGSNLYAASRENDEGRPPPRLVVDYTIIGGGLSGDYNDDGSVDAADYVVWRKNDGTSNTLPNDDGLGTPIRPAHYDLWQANFGMMTPGSGGGLGIVAVPEPTVPSLIGVGIMCFISSRRRISCLN